MYGMKLTFKKFIARRKFYEMRQQRYPKYQIQISFFISVVVEEKKRLAVVCKTQFGVCCVKWYSRIVDIGGVQKYNGMILLLENDT